MTSLLEPMPWDSEFFGLTMARTRLDDATPELLEAIDEEARSLGVDCLVGELDPTTSSAAMLVQTRGHLLVEIGISFDRAALEFVPPPRDGSVRRGNPEDIPRLGPLVDGLVRWSRFAVDPRFGPVAARRMVTAWIERAAYDEDDRFLLLVAEDPRGQLVGLMTAKAEPVPCTDLVSVIEGGSGAAQHMMTTAFEWADADGAYTAGVAAARNLASMRYCELLGFRTVSTRYLFHRWYTPER